MLDLCCERRRLRALSFVVQASLLGEEGGWAVELIPMDFYLG